MSDPRHSHDFEPNRRGLCKQIVGAEHCGQPEDSLVHNRTDVPSEDPADWADDIAHKLVVTYPHYEIRNHIAAALRQAEQRGREQERAECDGLAFAFHPQGDWNLKQLYEIREAIAAAIRARGKE